MPHTMLTLHKHLQSWNRGSKSRKTEKVVVTLRLEQDGSRIPALTVENAQPEWGWMGRLQSSFQLAEIAGMLADSVSRRDDLGLVYEERTLV